MYHDPGITRINKTVNKSVSAWSKFQFFLIHCNGVSSKKIFSQVFEIPRKISWHLMSLHGEIEVRRPTLMFLGHCLKNVEVEDEQLWSIDE